MILFLLFVWYVYCKGWIELYSSIVQLNFTLCGFMKLTVASLIPSL